MKRAAAHCILVLFFFAFLFQNRYAIFCIDDWLYAFVVDENAQNYMSVADDGVTRTPVGSLSDAFYSQANDYAKSNGRFMVHSVVQYICGTMSMSSFVIMNSLVFALFTLLLLRLTFGKPAFPDLLLTLSAIWLLLPHKGLTFMGNVSIGVNYLWSCVATLLFIALYQRMLRSTLTSKSFLFCFTLYALVAGSLQESFSLPVSGALLAVLLLRKSTRSRGAWIVAWAYVVGMLFCVLSPANFSRAGDIGGFGLHLRSFVGLASSPVFVLLVLMCLFLTAKHKLAWFIRQNLFLFATMAVSLAFVVFIAYNGRHQLTFINVVSLLLLLRGWQLTDYGTKRVRRMAVTVMVVLSLVSYFPILNARKSYYDSYQRLIETIEKGGEGTVYDGSEFESLGRHIRQNYLLEGNYVQTFTFNNWDFYERSLSVYLTRGRSNALVTVILPEDSPEYRR